MVFFFAKKKKASSHACSACDEASYYLRGFLYLDSSIFMPKIPLNSFVCIA